MTVLDALDRLPLRKSPIRVKKAIEEPKIVVITVSRLLGTGGKLVAQEVGTTLGIPVYDQEILNFMADHSRVHHPPEAFQRLDEQDQGRIAGFTSSFQYLPDRETYHMCLRRVCQTLSKRSCIILGRGCHLLLPDSLRVRIDASMKTRINNLVQFEQKSHEAAKRAIRKSDRERNRIIAELARTVIKVSEQDPEFDLVINTDRVNVQEAALLVIHFANMYFSKKAP